MQLLTATQRSSLEETIYMSLIAKDKLDMGEMGEAQDEANRIVSEWMNKNHIYDA